MTYEEIDDWQDEAIEDEIMTKEEFFYFVARGAQFVRAAFEEKRTPVLVHCLAGQNRSASVIVGYLSSFGKKKKPLEDVLDIVETANRKRNAYTLTQVSYKEALVDFPTWIEENKIL
jgi:protein-tyrosine phosphatase